VSEEYGLVVVVPPAVEPITLEQFKVYQKVDADLVDQDELISNTVIPSARERCEAYANRAYLQQTLRLTLNAFRDPWNGCERAIQLPRPPLLSVTSIEYLDAAGTRQTLSPALYRVDTDREPGRVLLRSGASWPTVLAEESVVYVTYLAGYGQTAADVPAYVRDAVYLAAAQRFEHREEIVTGTIVSPLPVTATSLLRHDRISPV
jgi:uncharacterized phiE125 gp8 family phage protein